MSDQERGLAARAGRWVQRVFPGAQEQKASAAKPLIALQHLGAPVWTPRDYVSLSRSGFQKNVIAYRCIRMIAEAAVATPFAYYERGRLVSEHPLQRMLSRPNPEQSGVEFLEAFYGFLQTSGNAYMELASLGGAPRELYVLRPDRIKVKPDATGWPDAYEYTVGGRKTTFRRDPASGASPILHVKLFNPLNDYYGMSPLEAASASVDLHNASAHWNKSLLDNAARPSGAIVYSGPDGARNLSDEQFQRLKSELQDAYQGAENAGRPLLLEGGLDWRQMSLSPADMDFINAKNVSAREIALAFGVPPMLLGIPGDNTFSNYREANLAFWKQTVLPLAGKAAMALTNWLGPMFDDVRIGTETSAVDALSHERDAMWARLERASFLTVNEKRQIAGLAPIEGGDGAPSGQRSK